MRVTFSFLSAALALVVQHVAANNWGGCPINKAVVQLPLNQTSVTIPNDASPNYIALGFGFQNYTCNATTNTYASAGAVAELFDISCLYGKNIFPNIQDFVYNIQIQPGQPLPTELINKYQAIHLGHHYFINYGTGISPLFDFREAKGPDAYVIARRLGGIPAPVAGNIDWLSLGNVEGGLAKYVLRVDTKGGTPPPSCNPGDTISVKYATKYWFYK